MIRTKRPFFKSRPGVALLISCLAISILVLILPLTGLGHVIGFVSIGIVYYTAIGVILALYTFTAELLKRKYLLM